VAACFTALDTRIEQWSISMAKRSVVVRTDDFDGKELGPGEGQTITGGAWGVEYEIDLSDKNAQNQAARRHETMSRATYGSGQSRTDRGTSTGVA
jgi:hypothetical protein